MNLNRKHWFWIAVWVVLLIGTGVLAFGYGRGPIGYYDAGPGWGPMGGWGAAGPWRDEERGDAGAFWRGMGPGMMDWGGGWHMRGPGFMGYGRGYGPGRGPAYGAGDGPGDGLANGMYGMGYGRGYGMMAWALPDLTPEQARQLGELQNDPSGKLNALAQQTWAAQATLARLQSADNRDWNAIRAAALALNELQRQRIEAGIELQQKMDALLSESQRKKLARARRGSGWAGTP